MKDGRFFRSAMVAWAGLAMAWPSSVLACATCFGKTDSRLAEGMNMGIFSLLAVVVCVLGGIASFFVYLARRSASAAAETVPAGLAETTK